MDAAPLSREAEKAVWVHPLTLVLTLAAVMVIYRRHVLSFIRNQIQVQTCDLKIEQNRCSFVFACNSSEKGLLVEHFQQESEHRSKIVHFWLPSSLIPAESFGWCNWFSQQHHQWRGDSPALRPRIKRECFRVLKLPFGWIFSVTNALVPRDTRNSFLPCALLVLQKAESNWVKNCWLHTVWLCGWLWTTDCRIPTNCRLIVFLLCGLRLKRWLHELFDFDLSKG